MAGLLKTNAFPFLNKNEDLYSSLVAAIINQQLSVAAAKTIHTRFMGLFKNKMPSYVQLIKTSPELLRSAGVSNQKAGYLKNIAQFGIDYGLNYHELKEWEDEKLIEYLTQIKGVGRWTAEMILMFNLNRLDVLPIDDIGIQNAYKKLYGINKTGKALKSHLLKHARIWSPYRSIACMYLWQWKDQS